MMISGQRSRRLKTVQATEDVLDAMTQYRVEKAKRAFVESGDEQEQQDNLRVVQAVTMLRGRLDEAKGDRRD